VNYSYRLLKGYPYLAAAGTAYGENMKKDYLLNRMPVVDDTAKIIAFIVSDRAVVFTGAIINASGGEGP
jgi:hypothetical protein